MRADPLLQPTMRDGEKDATDTTDATDAELEPTRAVRHATRSLPQAETTSRGPSAVTGHDLHGPPEDGPVRERDEIDLSLQCLVREQLRAFSLAVRSR